MTHAYTPAFDFNLKETENMTDKEIMELLGRQCSNWEKGAILRKAFDAMKPSAFNIKPQVQRKKRQPKTTGVDPLTKAVNGIMGHADNGGPDAH